MQGKVLSEDEGEDELDDVCQAQHAPKLENAAYLFVVLAGQVAEGEEDGKVKGQHLASSMKTYFAKFRSEDRNAIEYYYINLLTTAPHYHSI
jgi:hypothetical protein